MFGQVGIDVLHGFQWMNPLLVKMGQKPSLIRDFSTHLSHFLSSLSDRQWYTLCPPQSSRFASSRSFHVFMVTGQTSTFPFCDICFVYIVHNVVSISSGIVANCNVLPFNVVIDWFQVHFICSFYLQIFSSNNAAPLKYLNLEFITFYCR